MSAEDNKKVWDAVFSENALIAQKLEDIRTEKEGENSTTPLNSFRDYLDLTEYGFDESTTLQDLYNQKARELGLTRGLIEYQYDKAIDENPRVARNNELLRLVQQRLQDKETLPARYTPGGFAPHKLSAKKMRIVFRQTGSISLEKLDELAKTEEEYRVDYNILNPWTFVAYNKQNQAASELIGIFANQNTNHIFSSIAHEIKIVNGISFAGKGPLFDLLHSETDTEVTTAGFLAASVDAVKDPVLNFMNLNSLTADTGALLARIGFDTDDIALLFNQPIIREICDMYFNNHMSNFDNAVAKVRETYAKKVSASSIPTGKALGKGLSKQGLVDAIVGHNTAKVKDYWKNDVNNAKFQLEVLDTFMRARQASSELVAFVRATKFTAAKSIESTAGGLYHQMQVVKNYINNPGAELIVVPSEEIDQALMDWENQDILGNDRKTYLAKAMENPFAFEQVMYDMTRLFTTKVLGKFFPYETSTFKTTRNDMTAMTRNDILSKKSIDEIHKDLVLYILSKTEGSALNPDKILILDNGQEVTQEEYYRREFPKLFEAKMEERKKQGKKPNAFLNSIKVNQSKEGKFYLSIPNVLERNVALKEARMQGWSELALSEDTDDHVLAFDLFIYGLYNTGFNVRSSSFAHLATAFVKSELPIFRSGSYSDFLRMLNNDQFNIDSEEFALLYILNHPEDYQFVYQPYSSERDDIVALAKNEEGTFNEEFQVTMYKPNSNETTSYYSKVFLKVDRFQDDPNLCSATVIPAILIDNELYVMKEFVQGTSYYNHIEEMSIDEPITYVRMPILGKFGLKNYNPGVPKQTQEPQPQSKKYIKHVLSREEERNLRTQVLEQHPAYKPIISEMENLGLSLEDAVLNTRYLKNFFERYKKGSFIIFDTETTGLNVFEDDIFQIAAIKLEDGEVKEKFDIIIRTDRTIPAMLGNRINPMVEVYEKSDKVSPQEGLQKFIQFVGDSAILAHNLDYDYNILNQNFIRNSISGSADFLSLEAFDSLKLIRLVNPNLKSYRLDDIVKQLELQGEGTHDAKDDIIATQSVVDYCYDECQTLISQQDEFLNKEDVKEILAVLRQQYESLCRTLLPNSSNTRSESGPQSENDPESIQQQGIDDSTIVQQKPTSEARTTPKNTEGQDSLTEVEQALSNLNQYIQEVVKTSDEKGNSTESCKF